MPSLQRVASTGGAVVSEPLPEVVRRPSGASVGIVTHPGFQFGRPCVGFSRVTADTIGGMVAAGDSIESICDDYPLTREDVLIACWWYANDCATYRRKWESKVAAAWGAWAFEASMVLGGHKPGPLADPPPVESGESGS